MYVLQAKLGEEITTQGINARDDFSAKVLATHKINANYVSDARYHIGEITLKDPKGNIIWTIPEIKTEGRTEIKVKKERR